MFTLLSVPRRVGGFLALCYGEISEWALITLKELMAFLSRNLTGFFFFFYSFKRRQRQVLSNPDTGPQKSVPLQTFPVHVQPQ